MKGARLPKALMPQATGSLVRLGEPFDGGYVVDRTSIERADLLIALGVGDSWAFEADCLRINPVPLEAYDGSVGPAYFRRRFFRSLRRFYKVRRVRHRWRIWRAYSHFFRESRRHHMQHVGRDMPPAEVSLAQVFAQHGVGPEKRAFAKIDIESGEYALLDTLIDNRRHLTGLAIEFHGVDQHLPQIIDFVARVGFAIAHVHCNNFSGLTDAGTPEVIEVSFTTAAADTSTPRDLPGPLDVPNNPAADDIPITFV